ncbi:histidinol-phosphate transaminase [Catalinimonas niigatensis]|uniref:histidinol-phosphate transaminase n=1 Tax=Catalinimonas niigatensis TaxID=1397264 RepID=UPI002665592F|nr:histidinol-phosphate transaminase [Catalinimonas niigatensis]WPP49581.1 histidinol-phosphate transaminase [Catalinimonas niigatensis]
MAFDLQKTLRPHIAGIKPYSSARDEYSGTEGVFLDANENSFGTPGVATPGMDIPGMEASYHRYPDPYQQLLKKRIAEIKQLPVENIFLGNGSDEAIDLLVRAFCRPGIDNMVILPPTYGMYEVSAAINDVPLKKALLTEDFLINKTSVDEAIDTHSKLLFFCSPNNPSGNLLQTDVIEHYLQTFEGVVVVDEAYIDFADAQSWSQRLADYPNLVVMQTMSKAWGMAALRLGMAFASKEIIAILNKIKPPYNINALTQQAALKVLEQTEQQRDIVQKILAQRKQLQTDLEALPLVEKVFPSDANFLLVKVQEAAQLFHYLIDEKVIVRDRSKVILCEGCLRITVGTEAENQRLLSSLKRFMSSDKFIS